MIIFITSGGRLKCNISSQFPCHALLRIRALFILAEDGIIQDEYLLKRLTMQDLCSESAKLKSLGAMQMIETDKLVRLLNVLEINIRGGDRVSPITDVNTILF